MRTRHAVLLTAVLVMGLQLPSTSLASRHRSEPLVIGHRGAPAYRPEHTLGSYQLAIDMGADFVEPDLVSTKDHVLVARHENNITDTTDVAQHQEFAGLKRTKVIDGGAPQTGWFTEDFTLAQLKTLRAIERLPALRAANTVFNGVYEIPTFQEVIDLAKREHVGIYPETKHPTYFDGVKDSDGRPLSLEEPLVAALKANGLDRRDAAVFVQSFEVGNLKQLNRMTKVPIVQLTGATGKPFDDPRTYAQMTTPAGLLDVARYADGLGPEKGQIVPRDSTGHLTAPTSLVKHAHRAGLLVHPYTFRPENSFLPADFQQGNPSHPAFLGARGNQPAELKLFYRLGVDGLFADNPDTAVAVRRKVFR